MKNLFITTLLLTMIGLNGYAQKKNTFITTELGMSWERIDFSSTRNTHENPSASFAAGFLITQQIYKPLYLETGIYNRHARFNIPVTFDELSNSMPLTMHRDGIQIPIRVVGRFGLFRRVECFAAIGLDYNYLYHTSSSLFGENAYSKKNYWGFNGGAGIDYFFMKNLSLGVAYRYTGGFRSSSQIHVTYNNSSGFENDLKLKDKAQAHGLLFRIQYRFSSIWNR